MTEQDIDHGVKEILGARVVYVFAFLHLARWISVRNNSVTTAIPFDECIFIARCELSRENKNEKQNRIEKINGITKKPSWGES